MVEQEGYTIKLPTFEGPFDLLFHLIKKAEVDIWSISIAEITEQYLAYLQSMRELNLEIASEFLVMAATLLRLKSKLLLPRSTLTGEAEEDEELFQINTAEELFQRLEEYRCFKEIAKHLREKEEEQKKIFLRSTGGQKVMVLTGQESAYTIWEGAQHLSDIMQRFAEVASAKEYIPAFSAVEDFVIADKADYIESVLEEKKQAMPMKAFVTGSSLWEIIVVFIALLEMSRQSRVTILQERHFGPILVSLKSKTDPQEEVNIGERTAETDH
ncbi:MAG: segregation/condensation protein A [Bacillota bacterium]